MALPGYGGFSMGRGAEEYATGLALKFSAKQAYFDLFPYIASFS
jgi:hypothetical protein